MMLEILKRLLHSAKLYAWINIWFSICYYAIAFNTKLCIQGFASSSHPLNKELHYLVIKERPYWSYISDTKQIPRFGVKGT